MGSGGFVHMGLTGRAVICWGMSEKLRKRREHRRELLRRIYEAADGSVSEFVDAHEIGRALGLEDAESRRIFEYLEEKGWLLVDDHRAGIVRLTAAGVDAVEADA
jgi:hypothetical protein